MFIPYTSGSWRSEIRAPAGWGEDTFPVSDFLLGPHMEEGVKELAEMSFKGR